MALLGFTGGVPFLLTGSTLAVWLSEEGLSFSAIGFFSFMHLPYALKFLWAPLIEHLPAPFRKNKKDFGWSNRRGWILVSQAAVIGGLLILSTISPKTSLSLFSGVGLWLSFWAATHDLFVEACPIDTIGRNYWGIGEAFTVSGFRLGMLASGAGALALSQFFSWQQVYQIMAVACCPGFFVMLFWPLPSVFVVQTDRPSSLFSAVVAPFQSFIAQEKWLLILLFMLIFRLQDQLIGVFPNLFYLDLGFSKTEIAVVSKTFGVWMAIAGGFLGGYLVRWAGYKRALYVGAVLHALSSGAFLCQSVLGAHLTSLYITVALEDVTKGIAMTAFFSYQLLCCRQHFALSHLAILTAVTTIGKTLSGAIAGLLITAVGWPWFFLLTGVAAIPGLLLLQIIPFPQHEAFKK